MDSDEAEKIIEDTSSMFFEKSEKGELFLQVSLKDKESAKRLYFALFSKKEIIKGVDFSSVDWGIGREKNMLYELRSLLLDKVKEIRPLDYTEYE